MTKTKDNTKAAAAPSPEFRNVPVNLIMADPNQPRKYFNETDMAELEASIKEKGIIHPILIRPLTSDPNEQAYFVVCGERRFRAASRVELKEIPCVIRHLSDYTKHAKPAILMQMAKIYIPEKVKLYTDEQAEIASKRQARVKERIEALKKQK